MRTELGEIIVKSLKEARIRTPQGALSLKDTEKATAFLNHFCILPREAIGLSLDNSDCPAAYAALAFLDAVAVPLPLTLPEEERKRLWSELGCRFFIDRTGVIPLSSPKEPPLWPDGVHWVMHSSGSTGIPKAIAVTLGALRRNAQEVMEILGSEENRTHLGSMSHCYTNGLYNSFLLPLLTRGSVLVGPVASALKIGPFIEVLRSGRPDLVWVNPTVLSLLRRRLDPSEAKSIRFFISCTAPLKQEDCLDAEDFFGRPVLQSYGLTETMIVSIERPDRDAGKEFSAGVVVGGSQSISLNADGVLTIHNGAVTPGYAVRNGREIILELPNGGRPGHSFISGDLAKIDETGRLMITGRLTNVINVEGVKISPEQLEDLLSDCEGVERVVVVGISDRNGNERPVAMVKTNRTVDCSALADRCVHQFGVKARPMNIYVVPDVPLTANGKIDRPAAASLLSHLAYSSKQQ